MPADRWVISWKDIDPDPYRAITEVADSPAEAVMVIRRVLLGVTVVDEERIGPGGDYPPEAERSAFDAFFDGVDPEAALRASDEPLSLETDGGTIIVTRTAA